MCHTDEVKSHYDCFEILKVSVKPDLVCTERFDSGTLDLTAVDSTYPTHMLSDVVHQRCRHQSII